MITTLRSSSLRAFTGGGLGCLGLAVLLLALPNASSRQAHSEKAAAEANRSYQARKAELGQYEELADRLRKDRQSLEDLLHNMPAESVGQLHWKLSKKLYELAQKHAVRLVGVKYGAPSREGAKGSLLEALDVEFTVTGVFLNLKPFMLALEGSKLPFAVVSAKLDESPDGAHLTVVLRAFRQAPGASLDTGEGA